MNAPRRRRRWPARCWPPTIAIAPRCCRACCGRSWRKLDKGWQRKLIARAAALEEVGSPAADVVVHLARTLDANGTADALRDLATKLRKARKPEQALRVLRTLGRTREAAAEDGFQLAALELTHGLRDEAFIVFGQLAETGFDVATALRKERALEEKHRYDVGFHFVERQHPLGEEVLTDVVARRRPQQAGPDGPGQAESRRASRDRGCGATKTDGQPFRMTGFFAPEHLVK